MKKIIITALIAMPLMAGCNYAPVDTHFSYDRAIIYSPSGEVIKEGKVKTWSDYDDGDSIQVKFEDGSVYYSFGGNIVLISD